MDNIVPLHTQPQPRLTEYADVGALRLEIPVRLDGKSHTIVVGINVVEAPLSAWKDCSDHMAKCEAVRAEIARVFEQRIYIEAEGKPTVIEGTPLDDALANLIIRKMEGIK